MPAEKINCFDEPLPEHAHLGYGERNYRTLSAIAKDGMPLAIDPHGHLTHSPTQLSEPARLKPSLYIEPKHSVLPIPVHMKGYTFGTSESVRETSRVLAIIG
jgi:hypothetical protein